jgi:anti-sigma-K factor RskA
MTINPNHHNQPETQCEAIEALIADYAFGLTNHDEAQYVELNLDNCPEAKQQLADYRAIKYELRASVPQLEPSAAVSERLLKSVSTPATQHMPELIAPKDVPISGVRQHPHRAWLAAAAILIVLLASNALWIMRVDNLTKAQQIPRTVDPNGEDITNVANAFVLKDTIGLRWFHLPDNAEKGDASAFLVWDAESKIGLLYAVRFPQLEVGKVYQLWLTKGEERINAGTFRVDENGKGSFIFHIPESIDKYTWARITVEPEAGSAVPTGTVVVNGKISV